MASSGTSSTSGRTASTKGVALRPTGEPVAEVLDRIADPRRRAEADVLLDLMREVTGEQPVVWASRILGFGVYRYVYATGHSGEAPLVGFAVAARQHTLYLVEGFGERYADLMPRLGPHRAARSCLYVPRLSGVDLDVLRTLVARSLQAHSDVHRPQG